MLDLLQRLEGISETGNVTAALLARTPLSNLPAKHAKGLKARLEAVHNGIKRAGLHGGSQFPQTHFCPLPQSFADRIAHVVGKGEIPLAWIETLDTP